MTYILEIGDRRRLKAGIRVLHHTGHRAPCSGGRLNFAEARRATSAQPAPSEEDTPSSKNGKAKEAVPPVLQVSSSRRRRGHAGPPAAWRARGRGTDHPRPRRADRWRG